MAGGDLEPSEMFNLSDFSVSSHSRNFQQYTSELDEECDGVREMKKQERDARC